MVDRIGLTIVSMFLAHVAPAIIDIQNDKQKLQRLEKTSDLEVDKKLTEKARELQVMVERKREAPIITTTSPGGKEWDDLDKWIDNHVPLLDSDCGGTCNRSFKQFVSAYRDHIKIEKGGVPFNPHNLKRIANQFMEDVKRLE